MYFEIKFPVRYYETDQMSVVHHSNYIRYFECARNELMEALGYPISACEADGVTIPMVKLDCKYSFPARMGDMLTVTAEIFAEPMAKLEIKQSVLNQNGVVCASGNVTLGFLNKESGRPTRCPERLRNLIVENLDKRIG